MARRTLQPDERHSSQSELQFVLRIRRAIHRRPELGHHERRTAAYVERILRGFGLAPFRPAPTSIAVLIGSPDTVPSIGFRADMDAVPGTERLDTAYKSRNPGAMHACGHDAHTAALLVLARRLSLRPPRSTAVLLVFQQAEEGHPSGAPLVLEGLPPSATPPEFFAFHIWPELPYGSVGLRTGPMMASVAGVTIDIFGRAGRLSGTAADDDGVDAVQTGIRLYSRLRPDTGRQLDDTNPSALSIGVFNGGDQPNRVATHCQLRGTLRALSWPDQERAVLAIRAAAEAVADETGARVDVALQSGIRPPVQNAAASVARIHAACQQRGIHSVTYPDRPAGVSEDFGWYLQQTGGALFLLGCAHGEGHPELHSPDFDLDEAVLLTAVDVFDALVCENGPVRRRDTSGQTEEASASGPAGRIL